MTYFDYQIEAHIIGIRNVALDLANRWESEGKDKAIVDYLRKLASRPDLDRLAARAEIEPE